MKTTWIWDHGWLWVALIAYAAGACYNLHVPGANYDEMLYAAPAVNMVTGLEHTEPMQINPSVIHVFGRPFPLMVMTYIGGLKVAWHALFFAMFGVSVEVARLASVVLGLITLGFTYGWGRFFFGARVANVAVLLMGCSTEWAFYSSRDMTIVVMMLCKMAALYYGHLYVQGRKIRHIAMAGLLLGLGLYDKASFLWFIAVWSVYVLIFEWHRLRDVPRRAWMALAGAFGAGSLVFIVFNLVRLGATFAPVQSSLSAAGGHPWSVIENFIVRVGQLVGLLNGDAILELFSGVRYETWWLRHGTGLLAALVILAGVWVKHPWDDRNWNRRIMFLLFMVVALVGVTVYSPTVLSLHHVAIVWPFHWVLVAFAIQSLPRPMVRIVTGMAIALQLAGTGVTYRYLENHGATSNWSEAIYELSDYLVRTDEPTVAVSWGFTDNLLVTTAGRVTLVRLYRELIGSDPATKELLLRRELADGRRYLVKTDQQPDDDAWFTRVAGSASFHVHTEREFRDAAGRPLYRIYAIHRDSSAQF